MAASDPHDHPPGAPHDHAHDHAHDHDHDHDHDHGHGHGHSHDHGGPASPHFGRRLAIAAALVACAIMVACLVRVRSGTAAVVTRFGEPVRVVLEPGLSWSLPPPIERVLTVDLRLHTTSSGQHGVLTKDGLSVVVQAYIAWHVKGDPERVTQFVRAVRNDPDTAADRLRLFLASSLETVSGRFEFAGFINTDPSLVRLDDFEKALSDQIAPLALSGYGIAIDQVGIERLKLPETTVSSTIERMSAERNVVAEEKKAAGRKQAGQIRSDAERDQKIKIAQANEEASKIDAQARGEASAIYGKVHAQDPQLYAFIRSLDTLEQIITPTTRLILRTDAAPFNALVENPATAGGAGARAAPAAPPTGKPGASTAPKPEGGGPRADGAAHPLTPVGGKVFPPTGDADHAPMRPEEER